MSHNDKSIRDRNIVLSRLVPRRVSADQDPEYILMFRGTSIGSGVLKEVIEVLITIEDNFDDVENSRVNRVTMLDFSNNNIEFFPPQIFNFVEEHPTQLSFDFRGNPLSIYGILQLHNLKESPYILKIWHDPPYMLYEPIYNYVLNHIVAAVPKDRKIRLEDLNLDRYYKAALDELAATLKREKWDPKLVESVLNAFDEEFAKPDSIIYKRLMANIKWQLPLDVSADFTTRGPKPTRKLT